MVRSLGRAGHKIVTCSHAPRPLAASSRYVSTHMYAANPLLDQVRFVDDLIAAIRKHECEVVFPVTEQAHIAILTQAERLAGVCLPCPDADVFMRVADKEAVLAAAKAVGIATPNQIRLDSPNVAGAALPANVPFPVVLKPARSVVGGAKHVVRYAADDAELKRQLESLPPKPFPCSCNRESSGQESEFFFSFGTARRSPSSHIADFARIHPRAEAASIRRAPPPTSNSSNKQTACSSTSPGAGSR